LIAVLDGTLLALSFLEKQNCMASPDRSLAVGDLQIHSPVLTFEKIIRSQPRVVDETAREITAALTHLTGFDDAELVALAIREALSNALVHGNHCDPEKTIRVSIALDGDGAVFASIKDSGLGFDPRTLPSPLAVESLLTSRGRGIFFMRQFMDEVEFNFDHGTEVRMRRREKWFE
jgi:serine/threonine-protein kinase RsbW